MNQQKQQKNVIPQNTPPPPPPPPAEPHRLTCNPAVRRVVALRVEGDIDPVRSSHRQGPTSDHQQQHHRHHHDPRSPPPAANPMMMMCNNNHHIKVYFCSQKYFASYHHHDLFCHDAENRESTGGEAPPVYLQVDGFRPRERRYPQFAWVMLGNKKSS